MKKHHAWIVSFFLALVPLSQAGLRDFTVTERGPDHREWRRNARITLPDGRVTNRVHRFVELATGLHYLENGEWKDSREEIEINGNNASARRGRHTVDFNGNLNSIGAISLTGPNGERMRSHVLAVAYTDVRAGQSVVLGQIKNSHGTLLPPNEMLYSNAFSGILADVRYIYKKSGLEQDVILRENPPSPAEYGLDPATTELEVWTEFVEAPNPVTHSHTNNRETFKSFDFGSMHMIKGSAFPLGSRTNRVKGASVRQNWLQNGGRSYLIEAVPYKEIKSMMGSLPPGHAALPSSKESRMMLMANIVLRQKSDTKPVLMAGNSSAIHNTPGFVMDYILLDEWIDTTLESDTTYFISDSFGSNTLIVEGGAVVKYGIDAYLFVNAINCKTDMHNPAFFTAQNDNTVGEDISAEDGATHYSKGMEIAYNGSVLLKHLRFSYADCGVQNVGGRLWDVQFRYCGDALVTGGGTLEVDNVLMHSLSGDAFAGQYATTLARHVTVSGCNNLVNDWTDEWSSAVLFKNCVLQGFNSYGDGYYEMDCCGEAAQLVAGLGNHYLYNDDFRNSGTTNIPTDLLADIRCRTTAPPIVLTGILDYDLTLNPRVACDTNAPDIGYHYPPVDYVISGLVISNATLTLTNGVSVAVDLQTEFPHWAGWSGYWGFVLSGGKLISEGSPSKPNRILRTPKSQEPGGSPHANPWYIEAMIYDRYWDYLTSVPDSEVRLRFTECEMMAADGHFFFSGRNLTAFEISHSTLRNIPLVVELGGTGSITNHQGTGHPVVGITNTLFDGGGFGAVGFTNESSFDFRNNLVRNGFFSTHSYANSNWTVRDNLFETSTLADYSNNVANSHNAFFQTNGMGLAGGISNIVLTNLTYVAGPLGTNYQPTNSQLLNAGSRSAADAGFYHFTTTTNQVKETNSVVDIGPHYLSLTGNGAAPDADSDGIPDYLEDRNGNGAANSHETDWQSLTDLGFRIFITRPRNNSVIP